MRQRPLFTVGCVPLALILALPPHAQFPAWGGTPQEEFLNGSIVAKYQCTTCHTITDVGGTVGPILNHVGMRRDEAWIRRWVADPQAVKPGTKMPKFDFTPEENELLVRSLTRMTRIPDVSRILAGSGTPAEKGEKLFHEYDCLSCHRVGNEGRFVGPDLTWLGLRKTRDWERVWISDPEGFKPGTFMPNFHLRPGAVDALTAYLEGLRGQSNGDSQSWEFMVNMFLNNKAARRGEFIFKRFACWSCHGEEGRGQVRNPNAAPDEVVPPLTRAALDHSPEELKALLASLQVPGKLDEGGPVPPFFCPAYGEAITGDEIEELYAYLESLAPKRSQWKIR